jgi:multiple sugar transport system substrate-binding protein
MCDKLKKVISVVASAAIILAVAACGEPASEQGGRDAPDTTQSASVQSRALELKDHAALPEVEVKEKIQWLSWFAPDPHSPTMELFKAKYGIPGGGDTPIERIRVAYEQRYIRLNSLISSGDSPDMFQFEERNFPWGAYSNQFLPVDDMFDFSSPEWDNTRSMMELFEWDGRKYCAITEIANSSSLIFYRKSVAQNAGLDDPYELWMDGKWNWDTFLDMCQRFTDVQNGKYALTGWYNDESAILTTGTGIVSIENGKLVNNLDDGRIERAMQFLHTLSSNDYRYPYHVLNNYQLSPRDFRSGNILFWNDGPWFYQETLKDFRDRDDWAADEIRIVPFPKDPLALNYYQRGKQDALMLVRGSQNRDGFKAWTMCALIANQDEQMIAFGREKMTADFGWTEHQITTLEKIRTDLTPVFDFKNGIGSDVSNAERASPVENLTKPVIIHGLTYTQQRETFRNVITRRINDINNNVSEDELTGYSDCGDDPGCEECDACQDRYEEPDEQ